MTTVYVSQVVGEERIELAVALDGDGEVSDVQEITFPGSRPPTIAFRHVSPELRDRLDWGQLAEDARAALNARIRGWP